MSTPKQEVAERAHAIWNRKGRPPDTQMEDWLAAETELRLIAAQAQLLAGNALLERGQFLQAILDNPTVPISVKDVQGRYLLLNLRFESLFGVPDAQGAGKTDYDYFPAAIADRFHRNDLRVLAARVPLVFAEAVSDGEGRRNYSTLRFPICGADRTPYAVCSIFTDVTVQKQAELRQGAEHAVTRVLVQAPTLGDAAPRILQAVCESLGWEVGIFWIVDLIPNLLRCLAVWETPVVECPSFDRLNRWTTFSPGTGLPGRVWAGGQPVWIANVAADAGLARPPVSLTEGLYGACGFPVGNGHEILGVMEFFSRAIREPDERIFAMMGSVGSQVAQFADRKQAEIALLVREREFSLARAIQQRRLPKAAPALTGFDIAGASIPAQETGGDYLDYIRMADGSRGVAVGDASGHGIGAALLMAETRAYLRALARTETDVGSLLTLVNWHILEDIAEDDFVTLLFARLDPHTCSLVYANAGHWPGYVLDARGELKTVLGSTGLPLGIDRTAAVPAGPALKLEPGDLVLMLSDGIVEAFSEDGPRFGTERTLNAVRLHRDESSGGIVAALLDEVLAFSRQRQIDDMTVVVIKVGTG